MYSTTFPCIFDNDTRVLGSFNLSTIWVLLTTTSPCIFKNHTCLLGTSKLSTTWILFTATSPIIFQNDIMYPRYVYYIGNACCEVSMYLFKNSCPTSISFKWDLLVSSIHTTG